MRLLDLPCLCRSGLGGASARQGRDGRGYAGFRLAARSGHVIVTDDALYDRIPEPEDDENDMLDLAFGLTETSRLGCQVKMSKELDGLVVKLPSMTRNMQASDFS